MPETYQQHVEHTSAWQGSDFDSVDAISFDLQNHHLLALDMALCKVHQRGLTLDTVERGDFDLTDIADDIAGIKQELLYGTGIIIIRGFPVEDYSQADVEIMYWGLGTHFGRGESQSNMGDRLGHVQDVSGKDPNERAYRNSVGILAHTDLSDIVGMLSIRKAKRGGISTYTSAVAIHNKILATRPELLAPLYRGYRYHRFGEQGPGEPVVTPYRIPILSAKDGVVSARYVPEYVTMAAEELGEPLEGAELEALTYFNALAVDPELRFDIMLEPGDLSLINNFSVLHTRDEFFDGEVTEEKRLLLRLWLTTDEQRPLDCNLDLYDKRGIPQQQGRGTYYDGPTKTASGLDIT